MPFSPRYRYPSAVSRETASRASAGPCGDGQHVEDGLGRQSRYGSAADVVYRGDPGPARRQDGRRLPLEYLGPLGAVLHNLDVFPRGAK